MDNNFSSYEIGKIGETLVFRSLMNLFKKDWYLHSCPSQFEAFLKNLKVKSEPSNLLLKELQQYDLKLEDINSYVEFIEKKQVITVKKKVKKSQEEKNKKKEEIKKFTIPEIEYVQVEIDENSQEIDFQKIDQQEDIKEKNELEDKMDFVIQFGNVVCGIEVKNIQKASYGDLRISKFKRDIFRIQQETYKYPSKDDYKNRYNIFILILVNSEDTTVKEEKIIYSCLIKNQWQTNMIETKFFDQDMFSDYIISQYSDVKKANKVQKNVKINSNNLMNLILSRISINTKSSEKKQAQAYLHSFKMMYDGHHLLNKTRLTLEKQAKEMSQEIGIDSETNGLDLKTIEDLMQIAFLCFYQNNNNDAFKKGLNEFEKYFEKNNNVIEKKQKTQIKTTMNDLLSKVSTSEKHQLFFQLQQTLDSFQTAYSNKQSSPNLIDNNQRINNQGTYDDLIKEIILDLNQKKSKKAIAKELSKGKNKDVQQDQIQDGEKEEQKVSSQSIKSNQPQKKAQVSTEQIQKDNTTKSVTEKNKDQLKKSITQEDDEIPEVKNVPKKKK